jgi:hypothetical protein
MDYGYSDVIACYNYNFKDLHLYIQMHVGSTPKEIILYGVSQEECARLWENVP